MIETNAIPRIPAVRLPNLCPASRDASAADSRQLHGHVSPPAYARALGKWRSVHIIHLHVADGVANTSPLVRLLRAYFEKDAATISANAQQVEGILGVFQKLIAIKVIIIELYLFL